MSPRKWAKMLRQDLISGAKPFWGSRTGVPA